LHRPLLLIVIRRRSTAAHELVTQRCSVARLRRLYLLHLDDFLVFLLIFFDLKFTHSTALDLFEPFALKKALPWRLEVVKRHAIDFLNSCWSRSVHQSPEQLTDTGSTLALIDKVDGRSGFGIGQLHLLRR